MNFVDYLGRYHDKPVTETNRVPSNNGWVYTAYAYLLGLPVDRDKLRSSFNSCHKAWHPLVIHRSPWKFLPPMSRDEILGMVLFGYIPASMLILNNWQFCDLDGFKPKKWHQINWPGALWSLLKMGFAKSVVWIWDKFKAKQPSDTLVKLAHRNQLWSEKALWPLGFSLPIQDRWFVLKRSGHHVGLFYSLWFYVSSWLTVRSKDNSGKMILWLKLLYVERNFLGNPFTEWLLSKIDVKKVVNESFMEGHPFRDVVK